jgi:hypothetical protein
MFLLSGRTSKRAKEIQKIQAQTQYKNLSTSPPASRSAPPKESGYHPLNVATLIHSFSTHHLKKPVMLNLFQHPIIRSRHAFTTFIHAAFTPLQVCHY